MNCCGRDATKLAVVTCVVSAVTFIAFFAVLVAGITIVSTPYDFENLPYFENTICTPVAVTVVKMSKCGVIMSQAGSTYYDEYVAIWKCEETGASILENPFAGNSKQVLAQNSIDDFPLKITQNVTCNSLNLPTAYPGWKNFFQCQVWNTCFFDIDMIEDLQANALNRYNTGYDLLYASAGIVGFSIIGFIIFLILVFECCAKTRDSQYV